MNGPLWRKQWILNIPKWLWEAASSSFHFLFRTVATFLGQHLLCLLYPNTTYYYILLIHIDTISPVENLPSWADGSSPSLEYFPGNSINTSGSNWGSSKPLVVMVVVGRPLNFCTLISYFLCGHSARRLFVCMYLRVYDQSIVGVGVESYI